MIARPTENDVTRAREKKIVCTFWCLFLLGCGSFIVDDAYLRTQQFVILCTEFIINLVILNKLNFKSINKII